MNANEIDDIIDRVGRGETSAYAGIVRAYQHQIWRVAVFALQSREETEDLVQQAFVIAYRDLDRYQRGRDFGAWLRGIARNLVREHIRRRVREGRNYRSYHVHLAALGTEDASRDEREASLRKALGECRDELSDQARTAIELRYERALDFAAIADAIGRTVAGARQLLQRTRLQLRNCIQGKLA